MDNETEAPLPLLKCPRCGKGGYYYDTTPDKKLEYCTIRLCCHDCAGTWKHEFRLKLLSTEAAEE